MEKQRVQVSIGGRMYVLVSDDSPEHIRRVAAYADRVLRDTVTATRLPEGQAYAMAAVSLAEDLLQSKDENARLRRQLHEALDRLEGKENE